MESPDKGGLADRAASQWQWPPVDQAVHGRGLCRSRCRLLALSVNLALHPPAGNGDLPLSGFTGQQRRRTLSMAEAGW